MEKAWGQRLRLPASFGADLHGAVFRTIFALILFFFADGALFHNGWYSKYLEPDSTTGAVEYHLFWLGRAVPPRVPEVLVVGDSRIAEGFSAVTANASAGQRVQFTNFGMPGATPRVWYYAVRDADPRRARFTAIVIPFDDYADEDRPEDPRDFAPDINYLAGRLRYTDCSAFSGSFETWELRRRAFSECLLRGIAFRSDLSAFLSNIPTRLARARDWRDNGAGYIAGYGGKPEELTGLSVDLFRRTIHFPPGLKPWQTDTVNTFVLRAAVPQTGALTEYRQRWIGGMLDLYANSSTRIVFMQIPRAPWPLPYSGIPWRMIDSVKNRRPVTVLPKETFSDLEHPEVFADGLHLNHTGREIFSERLGRIVSGLLKAH